MLRPPPLEPFGAADAARWLESDVQHWRAHGFGPWLLFDRAHGGFVGRAGLRWTEVEGQRAIELAWALLPESWGRPLRRRPSRQSPSRASARSNDSLRSR